ncbi:MAG: hypothetical protein WAP37_02030 [Solirubrobacterales bacterium]
MRDGIRRRRDGGRVRPPAPITTSAPPGPVQTITPASLVAGGTAQVLSAARQRSGRTVAACAM